MPDYIPPTIDWVREQVELYEASGGREGTTLMDTGLPVVLISHVGAKTGGLRKLPLMRVKVDEGYVLVGSAGGAEKDPVWVNSLRAHPLIALRDRTEIWPMMVREVPEGPEYDRLWDASVAAFDRYADYRKKAPRLIPVFLAEPI
jgi:deazaflavin-dependent oxidoreductase (nitroreductase family)